MVRFDNIGFGKRIRQKRTVENDLRMEDVATELGISKSTISRCENFLYPDLDTFGKLCHWLNEPTDTFFIKEKKNKH